jgi:hypothetical protein
MYTMKTHYLETDYRSEWVKEILISLDHGFINIQKKYDENEWFDAYWAQEQVESIYGIAYVTAQTYITGTISDMSKISALEATKERKAEWMATAESVVNGISAINLMNAMANYFKHNEEWDEGKLVRNNKNTIEILDRCNINSETDFPCWTAAQTLCNKEMISDVVFLHKMLVAWRKELLKFIKNT